MTALLPDGIFFDLPMDVYVAQPRLGAHGLGKLLVSAATFWESSHLNPAPREVSAAVQATRTIGSAYHCARLELEHFADRYVRELDPAAHPGALVTVDDISAAIVDAGETPLTRILTGQTKPAPTLKEPERTKPVTRAARKEDLIEQLLTLNPDAEIWDLMLAKHDADNAGRIQLSGRVWNEIVEDGERLRQSPEVAALLDGGFAEVSILWTDERGVRCKCRPDKLKADMWLDLKTFSNVNGKHLEQAITDAVRYNHYYIGAAHYRDGIGMVYRGDVKIIGEATDDQRRLVWMMQHQEEFPACWYVFQERGGIPNILAKRMRFYEVPISTEVNAAMARDDATQRRVEKSTATPSLWWERARREIKKAKRTFETYSEVYAPGEPWLPFNPLGEISDLSFSAWFLDEEIGE